MPKKNVSLDPGAAQSAIQREEEILSGRRKGSAVGLAFSGGGIRSATFNLGVLQELESLGLLDHTDYLSTVSGGGYIGSWYLSCRREGIDKINSPDGEEAIRHLRAFSRYLAPEGGFFSADAWTIGAIWLRNTLLLQALLLTFFAAIMLLPRLFAMTFRVWDPTLAAWFAAGFFLVGSGAIVMHLIFLRKAEEPTPWEQLADSLKQRAGTVKEFPLHRQGWVQALVVLPLLAAGAFYSSALWNRAGTEGGTDTLVNIAAAVIGASATMAAGISLMNSFWKPWWAALLGIAAVGAACGFLFWSLTRGLATAFAEWKSYSEAGLWNAALFAAPAMLLIVAACTVLQIGLLGRAIDDSRREWWSRLGSFLGIYSFACLALSLFAIYGPLWVAKAESWLTNTVTLGWLATTAGGLWAARSRDTGENGLSLKELLAKAAPFVFIGGLFLGVSTGLHYLLSRAQFSGGANLEALGQVHWGLLTLSLADRWNLGFVSVPSNCGLFGLTVLVLALLSWRIDLNEFSMNPFYRNRLARCYLGAGRNAKGRRTPNRFTGLDFADDYGLAQLRPDEEKAYNGPVPIINTALNLAGGSDASLQERRARSFFFTPYMSGYVDGQGVGSVRATRDVGKEETGIRLGSCVSISGAAASPNMGFHTSAPVAFLMTFFNVRLGWWVRNPLYPPNRKSPRWGLWYLLKELFATADDEDAYIYLSDGGHFDNLGVYELVRRRCKYIICCDAEEDHGLVMESLGGLIRKCRVDFGVTIDIDTSLIKTRDAQGRSKAQCAVGRISYPEAPGAPGYLIYLKSSLTGSESADILQYKAQNPVFPHESTGDQFFSESQFESYRKLGASVVRTSFGEIAVEDRADLKSWAEAIERRWTPASADDTKFFVHAGELNKIWDALREDGDLRFLDRQLLGVVSPDPRPVPNSVEYRKAFYLCQRMIQLMENVYLDLQLEAFAEHPDHAGWMNLFRLWSRAPMMRETFDKTKDTYGTRFTQFWQTRLAQAARAAGASPGAA